MASTSQFQLRHILCVFAIAMFPLHWMGVACDIIHESSLSCHGDCGNVRMVPCSCDVTCVVLNKCCEDFAEHCPLVVTQAMERFPHLMNATVVCSKDSFFTIMSCPQEARENEQPFTQPDGNQSVSLLDLVNNAPVADLSTGFIFRNSEIYSCNRAEESEMVYFEIEIGVTSADVPASYAELNRNLDFQKVAYTPSADVLPIVAKSACLNEQAFKILIKCNEIVNVAAETVDKCDNGMYSYVKNNDIFYKNRYCLFCHTNQMENYAAVIEWMQIRHGFKLSVVPSLTNDGAVLKVVLKENTFVRTAWEEVECHLQDNEQTPDSTTCDVQCRKDFQLRPDGQCKILYYAFIGVPNDGYGFNEAEKSRFPDLISCFLQEHFDVDVVNTDPQTLYGCDDRLKRNIYLVTARVALLGLSNSIFPSTKPLLFLKTIKFSALVKAFLRHRMKKLLKQGHDCRVHTSSCYQNEDVDLASECRFIDKNKSTFQRFTSYPLSYLPYVLDSALRGDIVDNTTTAVCFSSRELTDNFYINCWEDPLYENDLNLISEYMNSKCFSEFEKNKANVDGISLYLFVVGFSIKWLHLVRIMVCDL